MRKALIFLVILGLLLTGCSKSANDNSITGNVVKETNQQTLENTYNCNDKKKVLQAELDSMDKQLADTNTQISDKLNELRKANTDEEKTATAAQLRDLRRSGRELANSIDALDNALSGLNCQ